MHFPLKSQTNQLRSVTNDGVGEVSRVSGFPETQFFIYTGNVLVKIANLAGPWLRLMLLFHLGILYYIGKFSFILSGNHWWAIIPAVVYWIVDLMASKEGGTSVFAFRWKRYSLLVRLDILFFALFGTVLVVYFTKDHIYTHVQFLGFQFHRLKFSRKDIECPVMGGAYGFTLESPLSADMEAYQEYVQQEKMSPFIAFVRWFLLLEARCTPDDRILKLHVGDHSVELAYYPLPEADLIHLRLQSILRNNLSIKDFQ